MTRRQPCESCGSRLPCIMCRGSGRHLYALASGPAWGDCEACWGTGIEHGEHKAGTS